MGLLRFLLVLLLALPGVAAEGASATAPAGQNAGSAPIPGNTASPNRTVSRDEATGEQGYKRVVQTFTGHTSTVVHLKIAKAAAMQRGRSESHRVGEASGGSEESDEPPLADDPQTQRCTPIHPFWVVGRGWVTSGKLMIGDPLVGSKGEALVVVGHEIRAEEADHFNFHVEGWNTYFVAERESDPLVWVHNKGVSDRIVGRLDGEVISRSYYGKLQNYLNKRGVDLRRGNESAFKVFKADKRPVMVLRRNATKYEVWHELSHYRHFKRVGKSDYFNLPRGYGANIPEKTVFETLADPRRWGRLSGSEQSHAWRYLQRLGIDPRRSFSKGR